LIFGRYRHHNRPDAKSQQKTSAAAGSAVRRAAIHAERLGQCKKRALRSLTVRRYPVAGWDSLADIDAPNAASLSMRLTLGLCTDWGRSHRC
jgi:hypothetical protein